MKKIYVKNRKKMEENSNNRENPDRRRNWKEYIHYRKSKVRNRGRKLYNRQKRNQRKEEMKENFVSRGKIKKTYYDDIGFKKLKELRVRRSGRYCLECDDMFCLHRAKKSAFLILYSQKRKDGAFSRFPKEIALMLAKIVYEKQKNFVEEINSLNGCIAPSVFSEVYLNYVYWKS